MASRNFNDAFRRAFSMGTTGRSFNPDDVVNAILTVMWSERHHLLTAPEEDAGFLLGEGVAFAVTTLNPTPKPAAARTAAAKPDKPPTKKTFKRIKTG